VEGGATRSPALPRRGASSGVARAKPARVLARGPGATRRYGPRPPFRTCRSRARRDAARPADRALEEIGEWAERLKQRIESGTPTAEDLRSLYRWSREFFLHQRRLHRFPGAYVVKAFNLAIKGLHYEIVMNGIVTQARAK
jgi:hypothetical protein